MFNLARTALVTLLSVVSASAFAAGNRIDYDVDNDGLIEIYDLADLDEIRRNLDGSSLYGVSTGCPETGCNGFELMADLDFDTNGDGVMDDQDTYWNDGLGWEPIASYDAGIGFTGNFDGNMHSIYNLYINRPESWWVGLFSFIGYSKPDEVLKTLPRQYIRNLFLTDNLTEVTAGDYAGLLAGIITATNVENFIVSGRVFSGGNSGIFAGALIFVAAEKLLVSGEVSIFENNEYYGGVTSEAFFLTLNNVFSNSSLLTIS